LREKCCVATTFVLVAAVRLCSGLFGKYSGKFGHFRLILGGRAEWTRILPNGIRVYSASFGAAIFALDILRLQKQP
jgi:hypothetical protein